MTTSRLTVFGLGLYACGMRAHEVFRQDPQLHRQQHQVLFARRRRRVARTAVVVDPQLAASGWNPHGR